ncbi:glutathione hydrolase 6 [Trichomycterus rosablanca]|uniref:glutathione hydrolase 6 n=1 Tax=Trichomycterus rosablanca TaxID=2290929 RepID=UPI002F357F24
MGTLILLGVALTFMVFEGSGRWTDSEELDDEDHHHEAEHQGAEDDHHHSHGHASLYHHAVVLTSSDNCSRVGRGLLEEGGNVVDAAIASLLCLGVVHPHTAGVGGMFSAILYNSTSGSLEAIRSTAPQAPSSTYGIPSILQGIKELHSLRGRSGWTRLFKEAITSAKEGFVVDEILGEALESHKAKIIASELCTLFCDADGRVKSVGAIVKNQKLSECLRSASLDKYRFLDKLAVKLSEDLSPDERPAFLSAIRRGRGEINDPLIVKEEKYTVLSADLAFAGQILSDILERIRRQSFSFQNDVDSNSTASYTNLLNVILELEDKFQAEDKLRTTDLFHNTHNGLIGVLDNHGNVVVMSASLNNTWGSGRFLPSTGILLSSFTANISDLPYFNFPLVIKITDDDDDGEDDDVEIVAVTGGLSGLFNAAFLLHNRIDLEMSSKEAISRPLLHLDHGNSSAVCLSSLINGSDVYRLFSERQNELLNVDVCSDHSMSMVLRLHAEHVRAYAVPVTNSQTDGY